MSRVYLDYNATSPICDAAKQAMIAACDVVGNPSSVHFEGRKARALLEQSREILSEAAGASGADIVFTSGATEAAALALSGGQFLCAPIEHPSVLHYAKPELPVEAGKITAQGDDIARQLANSETGILQKKARPVGFEDAVQAFGKIPYAFSWRRAKMGAISAHKIGGPKGIGALVLDSSLDIAPLIGGGGQEQSRRAGTENLIGIAGFAAAAKKAQADLEAGLWDEVEKMRDDFEEKLLHACPDAVIVGKDYDRLPNTSAIIVEGWEGALQVMQMDLAGYAISAGSACSSGKVKRSEGLLAMGYSEQAAASAIRISIAPSTNPKELDGFLQIWLEHYRNWRKKSA